jgi:hypothetical protein
MNVFRYPGKSLIGDYIRSGVGLAVGLSVLASASSSITIVIIFGTLTALFLAFGFRTVKRQMLRVAVTDEEIRGAGLGRQALPWGRLEQLKLRYYGSRRQRVRESSGGFMQLTLKGAGATMTLESSIDGFEYIAWRAVKAARENGVSLDPASAGNLLELGIDADADQPAPDTKGP